MSSKILINVDETYVHLDPAETPGKKFYHSSNPKDIAFNQKVKRKGQFSKKILVWQAMDSLGNVWQPRFAKGTINSNIYKNDISKNPVLPCINKLHKKMKFYFGMTWPHPTTPRFAYHICKLKASILSPRKITLQIYLNAGQLKNFGLYAKGDTLAFVPSP